MEEITREEIIEHFKYARTVICLEYNQLAELENLNVEQDIANDWRVDVNGGRDCVWLWVKGQFATIVEYKESVIKEQEIMKRKEIPLYSGLLTYFPEALNHVANCSYKGNLQHHSEKPLHWDKDKSNDHPDAMLRHLSDHYKNPIDEDGVLHLAKVAWRALANLEIYLEEQKEEPFDKKLF